MDISKLPPYPGPPDNPGERGEAPRKSYDIGYQAAVVISVTIAVLFVLALLLGLLLVYAAVPNVLPM
jgi:hypothetical protein